jgi:hypothetical protein
MNSFPPVARVSVPASTSRNTPAGTETRATGMLS